MSREEIIEYRAINDRFWFPQRHLPPQPIHNSWTNHSEAGKRIPFRWIFGTPVG